MLVQPGKGPHKTPNIGTLSVLLKVFRIKKEDRQGKKSDVGAGRQRNTQNTNIDALSFFGKSFWSEKRKADKGKKNFIRYFIRHFYLRLTLPYQTFVIIFQTVSYM